MEVVWVATYRAAVSSNLRMTTNAFAAGEEAGSFIDHAISFIHHAGSMSHYSKSMTGQPKSISEYTTSPNEEIPVNEYGGGNSSSFQPQQESRRTLPVRRSDSPR